MTAEQFGLNNPVCTINETAKALRTSRSAVYAMVHGGKLRLVKFGPKKSRIITADIVAVINEALAEAAG
jgi:excisionase family DNA binding protein